jgi:phage repressor protein C with HTH and peptisase S24 domain
MTFERTAVEILRRGVAIRFVATGDSMHPSIRHGEHVHVAPADPHSLRIGDVVLARAERGLTAHRIVQLMSDAVTTRGDNALRRDAALDPHAIIGRVTHVERDGAPVAVPSAPPRFRVAAHRVRRHLFSLSQLIRSFV